MIRNTEAVWTQLENKKQLDPKQSRLLSLIRENGSANIYFLMEHANLDWKTINYKLNGLVQRGMITKNDKTYTIKKV